MIIIEILKNMRRYILDITNRKYLHYTEQDFVDELSIWFNKYHGYKMDFNNPITMNEKIQWLKLFDSTELKGMLADKLKVREYVATSIGDQYLIPLIGGGISR